MKKNFFLQILEAAPPMIYKFLRCFEGQWYHIAFAVVMPGSISGKHATECE